MNRFMKLIVAGCIACACGSVLAQSNLTATTTTIGNSTTTTYTGWVNGKYVNYSVNENRIGGFTYSNTMGRIGDDRMSLNSTSSSIGNFGYQNASGSVGDSRVNLNSTSSRVGDFGYQNTSGHVGDSSVSLNSSISQIGDFGYENTYGHVGDSSVQLNTSTSQIGSIDYENSYGRVGDSRVGINSSASRIGSVENQNTYGRVGNSADRTRATAPRVGGSQTQGRYTWQTNPDIEPQAARTGEFTMRDAEERIREARERMDAIAAEREESQVQAELSAIARRAGPTEQEQGDPSRIFLPISLGQRGEWLEDTKSLDNEVAARIGQCAEQMCGAVAEAGEELALVRLPAAGEIGAVTKLHVTSHSGCRFYWVVAPSAVASSERGKLQPAVFFREAGILLLPVSKSGIEQEAYFLLE